MVDLRQAVRGFGREPGFTAVAIVALAIGIGSSTAMFSVVDTALLRPLPYTVPERLLKLTALEKRAGRPDGAVELFELEEHATTVEAIGAYYPHRATFESASGPRELRAANLSARVLHAGHYSSAWPAVRAKRRLRRRRASGNRQRRLLAPRARC